MTQEPSISFVDTQYKDASPLDTVQRIRKILKANRIEVIEKWHETSVPYCFALQLRVTNSSFGVNGKGLTREFALASAYGELMERLQLGYIGNRNVQKDGHYEGIRIEKNMLTIRELYDQNPRWYELLAKKLQEYSGKEESPVEILERFATEETFIPVTRYYDITGNRIVYYPTALQMRVYTSNGCAAGNTPEEAIVQAISEIVERHHQLRIIDEALCVPSIPENILMQYPAAYRIISYVRSQGYLVIMKDCSLGTGFPVVAACIIDRKSGKYHTHFGAYPVFEIALERALTESFQGHTISNIAQFENFICKKETAKSISFITQELVKGTGERSPNFFKDETDATFPSLPGLPGSGNRSLLRACIDFFRTQGFDVLVRDASCLGFPTYQVIIPGYSEIYSYRLSPKLDDHRYAGLATKVLRNPSAARPNEMMGLLMHLTQMSKLSANIAKVHGFVGSAKLALNLTPQENYSMLYGAVGFVYYALGKLDEAQKYADKLLELSDSSMHSYLICLKRYLSMVHHHYEPQQIRQTLELFHGPEVSGMLYGYLENQENPFAPFTLKCDLSCTKDCPVLEKCSQKRILALTKLINEKFAELDFDDSCKQLASILSE